MKPKQIRDIVTIRPHPTVVRLEDLQQDDAGWIRESYCLTGDVKKHLAALQHAMEAPVGTGVFLIGQYGSGKSHFLAWLISCLEREEFVTSCPAPKSVSLLNFSSDVRLEDVVVRTLDLTPSSSGDRREAWRTLDDRYPNGLVLMLDELSEFLRSKPSRQSYNEDVRFLQYMGEWTRGHRFFVIGALQEQIERTGDIEGEIYRKIKDRFPLRLLLSETHVHDLISKSILIKSDAFEHDVEKTIRELQRATPPSVRFDPNLAKEIYPVHPSTIKFLEEVRGQFSRSRGIVDFTVRQLGGDPAKDIPPFINRPLGEMLTPESIFDHYLDLLLVQPDFAPIAEKLLPHYREQMSSLFERERQQHLAWRLLKLLTLSHISPARKGISEEEATFALAFTSLKLNVAKNVEIVAKILARLAERGRYVTREGRVYRLNLEDDSAGTLERLLESALADLEGSDSLFEDLVPHLTNQMPHPFSLPREQWQPREATWHFHRRRFAVYLGHEEPDAPSRELGICVRPPWGPQQPAKFSNTVVPAPLEIDRVVKEAVAYSRILEKPIDKEVAHRARRALGDRMALIQDRMAAAYARPTLYGAAGASELKCSPLSADNFGDWLAAVAVFFFKKRYPSFENFAPTTGPLAHDAYRALLQWLGDHDLEDISAGQYVDLLREGYLVPMGLLKRTARSYAVPARLEQSKLIKLLLPLLDSHPEPKIVYEYLADSVFGLVPDQVHVLLIFLLAKGEVEILKGGRSLRELHETFPIPLQYDRIEQAAALDKTGLNFLALLCDGLQIRQPAEWSVIAQDRTAALVRDALKTKTGSLKMLLAKLRSDGGTGPLTKRISRLLDWTHTLESNRSPLDGLRQLIFEVDSVSLLISEIETLEHLPDRLAELSRERQRYQHLFRNLVQPAHDQNSILHDKPPVLEEPEKLETWLKEAARFYEDHKTLYAANHDTYWQNTMSSPVLKWSLPRLARSRHLGLEEIIETFEKIRHRIETGICRQLANVDFQSICHCGFNGKTAPIEQEIEKLAAIESQVDQQLAHFFAKESVHKRISKWLYDGLETTETTLNYVNKKAPLPKIENIEMLDEHLSGLEVVQTVELEEVARLLRTQTWDKSILTAEFDRFVANQGGTKLRFESRGTDLEDTVDVARWCLEQALKSGVPLPHGLPTQALEEATNSLQPDWINSLTLENLVEMGLPQCAEERIVEWILQGDIRAKWPENPSPLVACAIEIIEPSDPESPAELANLVSTLYSCHHQMVNLAPEHWIPHLNAVANWPGLNKLQPLIEALQRRQGAEWIIVDGLGVALSDVIPSAIEEHLPGYCLDSVDYVVGPKESDTKGFYKQFVKNGLAHRFFKFDYLDTLIHDRFLPLSNIIELLRAEIGIFLPSLKNKLAQDKPLIVFGDHGFSIAEDGRSYGHTTGRAMDRIVPLYTFTPRH